MTILAWQAMQHPSFLFNINNRNNARGLIKIRSTPERALLADTDRVDWVRTRSP